MIRTWLIAFLMLAVSPRQTPARELGPSFYLDNCGWHAASVVVVKTLSLKDGTVEILETWAGDLRKGDRLTLKELAAFVDPARRAILSAPGTAPDQVSGARLVLFLKRQPRRQDPSKSDWVLALRTVDESVAWVEDSVLFAHVAGKARETVGIAELSMTPVEMAARVRQLARLRGDLERATAQADPAQRAKALRPFVESELYYARYAAFEELARCGKPALPVLREMLRDPGLHRRHDMVVRALARAGGPDAGAELAKLLEGELAYWKMTAPGLPAGWWNGAGGAVAEETAERLRERYSVTLETIRGLRQARFPEGKTTVTAFRDYWRSLPQLEDKSGLTQMSEECDHVLAELKK
jgi:hypothetical protein